MKKRGLAVIALLALLVAGIFMFRSNERFAKLREGERLGLLGMDDASPLYAGVTEAIATEAERRGFQVERADAHRNITEQARQAERLYAQCDVIALQSISSSLTKAFLVRRPTVLYNDLTLKERSLLKEDGGVHVGTDRREAGRLQGQLLADILKQHPEIDRDGDGTIRCILLRSTDTDPAPDEACKAAQDAGISMNPLITETVQGGDSVTATKLFRRLLKEYDNVEAVFTSADSIAIGTVEALQETGWNKVRPQDGKVDPKRRIPVFGIDGSSTGKDAVDRGTLIATVDRNLPEIAKTVVDFAVRLSNGQNAASAAKDLNIQLQDDVSAVIPCKLYGGPVQNNP